MYIKKNKKTKKDSSKVFKKGSKRMTQVTKQIAKKAKKWYDSF